MFFRDDSGVCANRVSTPVFLADFPIIAVKNVIGGVVTIRVPCAAGAVAELPIPVVLEVAGPCRRRRLDVEFE